MNEDTIAAGAIDDPIDVRKRLAAESIQFNLTVRFYFLFYTISSESWILPNVSSPNREIEENGENCFFSDNLQFFSFAQSA